MECKGCSKGISMCFRRPCFGSPEEFNRILDAGFANKLQMDWWTDRKKGIIDEICFLTGAVHSMDIEALIAMPSDPNKYDQFKTDGIEDISKYPYEEKHNGGKRASFMPTGKCSMLNKDNLCSLHDLGLKPTQGQLACCRTEFKEESNGNETYVLLWNTDYGKSVIEKWKKLVNY